MNPTAAATANENEKGSLGVLAYLATAFGQMFGIGWLTMVGFWIATAGPLGAILGFTLGAILMAGVAGCYAELAGMMPISGGEVVYANDVFGRFPAFLIGWFLLAVQILTLGFSAVSLGWVLETLFPSLQVSPLFHFLGTGVTLPELIVGQVSLWGIYAINRSGLRMSGRAQEVLTMVKVVIMVGFIVGGLFLGQPTRALTLVPGITPIAENWKILTVFAATPYFIGGFSSVATLAGDRSSTTSMKTLGLLMVCATGVGALVLYPGMIIACSAAAPLRDTLHSQLPAAFDADAIFKSTWGGRALLLGGVMGIMGSMNAVVLSTSRTLRVFVDMGAWNRPTKVAQGSGEYNFTLIVALGALLSVAGQGALLPIVDSGALALIVCYFSMCLAALKLRLSQPQRPRPFSMPGGIPMLATIVIVMGCMTLFLLIQPLSTTSKGSPTEWLIIGIWLAVGAMWWQLSRRSQAKVRIIGS